jgi:hypothetical protein
VVLGWNGGSTVGYALRLGQRLDLGVEGALNRSEEDDVAYRAYAVRTLLKGYVGPLEGPMAPYWVLGFSGTWSSRDLPTTGDAITDRALGGFAGVGLDWFPTRRVSVGGHIGFQASALKGTFPELLPGMSGDEETGSDLRTISSGVRLQLYF